MSNISRFIGNERGDKICHEDDGCPTELAVLKRFWREQQASTLPEEVANLVELLDEEEVPYEDSLGVALSLTGRTKQYANGKTATLREQVEKLTMERDTEIARNRPLQSLIKSTEETKSFLLKKSEENKEAVKQLDSERQANALLTEELASLAEQNEKMRKVLLRLACLGNGDQYGNSIGNCIAQEALSLPNLATPVLNRIRAEAMEEAAKIANEHEGVAWAVSAIRNRKAELEKTNG